MLQVYIPYRENQKASILLQLLQVCLHLASDRQFFCIIHVNSPRTVPMQTWLARAGLNPPADVERTPCYCAYLQTLQRFAIQYQFSTLQNISSLLLSLPSNPTSADLAILQAQWQVRQGHLHSGCHGPAPVLLLHSFHVSSLSATEYMCSCC
jgi:hypothetical protein